MHLKLLSFVVGCKHHVCQILNYINDYSSNISTRFIRVTWPVSTNNKHCSIHKQMSTSCGYSFLKIFLPFMGGLHVVLSSSHFPEIMMCLWVSVPPQQLNSRSSGVQRMSIQPHSDQIRNLHGRIPIIYIIISEYWWKLFHSIFMEMSVSSKVFPYEYGILKGQQNEIIYLKIVRMRINVIKLISILNFRLNKTFS